MPGARHKILGHVLSGFCHKMNRCRPVQGDNMESSLNRCLTTFDITLLGIGHMLGAGIYVITGAVAHVTGPATSLSFLLAGGTSLLAALCYAEFGTRIPRAGSAYAYTYVSIGEFWAFVIGWNIVLEYIIGAASVARAWSGYLDSILGGAISNATVSLIGNFDDTLLGAGPPDVLAFVICLTASLILAVGVKTSAYINNGLTILNLLVICLVIFLGFYHANVDNWSEKHHGFMPSGGYGVFAGAATCFYAFVGFDSISAASEEAKDPSRSIPRATLLSLAIVSILYTLVALALTLMVPYSSIDPVTTLPSALGAVGADWARYVVGIGAVCGMTSTLLGSLFSLPRCLYAMSADGLLFSFLSNGKSQIPTANLFVSGFSAALVALFFNIETLVQFMSIGTLLAYTIVSAGVIILRYQPTSKMEERGFRAQLDSPGDREDSSATGTPCTEVGSPTSEIFDPTPVGRLKPSFAWLEPILGRKTPGTGVTICICIFAITSTFVNIYGQYYVKYDKEGEWHLALPFVFFAIIGVFSLLTINCFYKNKAPLPFKVPFVPLLPGFCILLTLTLMAYLDLLTWVRFGIWMTIGLLLYFLYGIHHSKLGEDTTGLLAGSGNSGWGAVEKNSAIARRVGRFARGSKSEDRKPIISDDDLSRP